MIRALIAFPVLGLCCGRWVQSMKRYLPDDIEIQVLYRKIQYDGIKADILMTQLGLGSWNPVLASVSPKVVFTEAVDSATISHFTGKDIIISYSHDAVKDLREMGYNALLMPRPCDSEVFYPETDNKAIEVMTSNMHKNGFNDLCAVMTDRIIAGIGGKHLIMNHPNTPRLDVSAEIDYCGIPQDDARMRQHYCQSKYVMSLFQDYEYYPDKWSVGWEASNIEALLCKCRPIVLRSKHTKYYEKWLGDLALYVDPDNFATEVESILTGEYKPITEEEHQLALSKFDASPIWDTIWEEVRKII